MRSLDTDSRDMVGLRAPEATEAGLTCPAMLAF